MDKISASFIATLSAIFLYLSLKNLFSQKISLICTLIYAFATCTWAVSSQTLWQQGAVELFLAILIYLVIINEKWENRHNFLLMGIVSGLLFFCRSVDGILLLPIIYYIFMHDKMDKFIYVIAFILVSLPFAAYNFYFFGNFFGGYNSAASLFSFNFEAVTSFLGLIISPNRGLLVFSPVCFLAFFGIFGIKNIKTKNMQYFFIIMAISVFCQITAYSFFKVWWGGWSYGPRFLAGMLPFIVFFLALYFDEFSKTTWNQKNVRKYFIIFVIALFICWSVFVQVVGAFYYPKGGWEFKQNVDQIPQRFWNWDDSLILQNFLAGPYPVNPASSFQKLFSITP
jgi:4-amino-4-deoxy-L-arabinose transferase-like glycosyltransferase